MAAMRTLETSHPAMRIMGLFFMFSYSSISARGALFLFTGLPITPSSSSPCNRDMRPVLSPTMSTCSIGSPFFALCRTSRSDTSVLPNKHTLRLPSLVMRRRLQVPQELCVMLVIKPIRPLNPGTCHCFEVASDQRLSSPRAAASRVGCHVLRWDRQLLDGSW